MLLFATFADIAGGPAIRLQVGEKCTVASLIAALQERFPPLQAYDLRRILVAVNREMADPDHPIHPGDEVGIFPPVSGG